MHTESALHVVDDSPDTAYVVPITRTWYGIAGSYGNTMIPRELCDSAELASARALIANADKAELGPWHVVTLTERLS